MQQPFFIGVINVVQLDVSINVGVVMSKTDIKKRLHTCYKNTAKGLHCRCLRIASFKRKYIRSIVERYIPGASKNKPFWKSNIEAAIFYLCSTKFLYYLCNALYYCKKKVTVILPLRNRIFHKNFVMIITLDNTSSNKWASDLRVNLIYQCFKVN